MKTGAPRNDVPTNEETQETPRILVVEDDERLRNLLAALLRLEGYWVVTAVDGEDALEALRETGLDLVVTDLCMPRMDGGELIRRMEQEHPSMPVLVMSGECEIMESFGLGKRRNVRQVLRKPISVERFLRQIAHSLRLNFALSKMDLSR